MIWRETIYDHYGWIIDVVVAGDRTDGRWIFGGFLYARQGSKVVSQLMGGTVEKGYTKKGWWAVL